MELDFETCERARRSRDPRFDGRFFVAVTSTGIYCRTVCPSRAARTENVRYYRTAAAAFEAGFRPCLRCRPETAPGTTAWLGTTRTVARALRLIDDVAFGEDDQEALADRLGVTARHLRRLFLAHLGATPGAVARTRRLHLAKTLIDGTTLPFTEVALASGFGSVRRFNAAFRRAYGRTPSALRNLRGHARQDGEGYRFRLGFRPPCDWRALLSFLRSRAIPGVEQASADRYARTFATDGAMGELCASREGDAVAVSLAVSDVRVLASALERTRRVFDLAADPDAVSRHLARDPLLRPLVRAHPGLRVPGAWDGFELAVRAILGQQVTVKGASTLAGRLAERFGRRLDRVGEGLTHVFPEAAAMADADLAVIGLPRQRAEALRALARAVADGRLRIAPGEDTQGVTDALCALPGVGDWTAQYVAMRALSDPDAFPADDLVLRRATNTRTAAELRRRAEAWRPWRAYAALYLWQGAKDDVLHDDAVAHRAVAAVG